MLGGKGADCCMGSGMSIGSLPSPNARLVQRTRGLGGSALASHRCVLRRCRDVARRHARRVRCTRRVARRRERWGKLCVVTYSSRPSLWAALSITCGSASHPSACSPPA